MQPHGWTLQGIMLREISQRKTNTISFHLESSEQIHRYREQTDSCQRGGRLWGWMKKVKELSRKKNHRHRQQCGDYQRERGVGEIKEGKRGINGDRRRLDLGW